MTLLSTVGRDAGDAPLRVRLLADAQAHRQPGAEPVGVDVGNPGVDAEGAEVGDAGDLLALTDRGPYHRGDRGQHSLPVGADAGPLQAAARFLPLAFEGLHLQLQGLELSPGGFDQVAAVLFQLPQLDAGALLLELRLAQLLRGDRSDTLQLAVLGAAGPQALQVQLLEAPAGLQGRRVSCAPPAPAGCAGSA